jgi:hypothetical protein
MLGGGSGTINQLDQWKSDGTNITQNVSGKPLRLTGLESLDCLGTDGTGIVGEGTCGGGGGGTPGGSDSYVQFNQGGTFGAEAAFSYASTSDRLTVTNASTTALSTAYASSTNAFFGTLNVPALTSALILTNGSGVFAEYAGTTCTNQFVRVLSALGAATCATVANTDLANSTVSYGGVTLSLGGTDASPAFNLADATGLSLTTGVTGTLPIANGGTGATAFGANRVPYMDSGNSALTSTATFVFDGTKLGIGSSSPNAGIANSEGNYRASVTNGEGIFFDAGTTAGIGSITRQSLVGANDLGITGRVGIGFKGGVTAYSPDNTTYDMYVTSAGSVGVGTTSPDYKFEVGDSANAGIVAAVTNSSSGTAASAQLLARNGYNAATESVRFMALGTGFTTSGGLRQDGAVLDSGANLSGGLSIAARAGGMRFYTGDIADANLRMTIANDGKIGVGTTTPGYSFGVVGNASFGGVNSPRRKVDFTEDGKGVFYASNNANENAFTFYNGGVTAAAQGVNLTFGISSSTGAIAGYYPSAVRISAVAEGDYSNAANAIAGLGFDVTPTVGTLTRAMSILSNGSVGIGTSSPMSTLAIESTGATALTIKAASGNSATIDFYRSTANPARIQTDSASNALVFLTNPGTMMEAARFTSAGRFGIGTSTPGRLLSVQGSANLSGDLFAANITATGTLNLSALSDGCLNVTSGAVGSTGSACGGGGGSSDKWATSTNATLGVYPNSALYVGVGTTTPRWLMQLATSTAPQLALSDGTLTSNHWTVRSMSNSLFFATSSPSTFATSTVAALSFNANGIASFALCPTILGTACTGSAGGIVRATSPTIATPTFTTSAVIPIAYGGTVAGGTLTLRSTSGAGVGADAIIFGVGNNGAVERGRMTLAGFGLGTTTPRSSLNIASSTAPQIMLSDASATSNPWNFRSISGSLYFATSSPTTFATSTSAMSINVNGLLTLINGLAATFLTMAGDTISDFTGFGMALASGALGLDTTGAADEECLTYESTGPGIEWQSCTGSANKVIFIPNTYTAATTNMTTVTYPYNNFLSSITPNGNVNNLGGVVFQFRVPSDYTSLVSMEVVMVPDTTETIQWDAEFSSVPAGSDPTGPIASYADQTVAVTTSLMTEVNVNFSSIFAGLAADEYASFVFQSDTSNLQIVGLRFEYQ